MAHAHKFISISASAFLLVALAAIPARAAACLDHSHSAMGSGSRSEARAGAKAVWAATVKADDGARWASLNNAKNARLSCVVKDPQTALNVCTVNATPCAAN